MDACVTSPSADEDISDREKETLRLFIETYETYSLLWNPRDPDYANKYKRNSALQKLLEIFLQLKPGATLKDVTKKINCLRSNYKKECNKILSSKRSGAAAEDVYSPSSWVFYAMSFLAGIQQPAKLNIRTTNDETNEDADGSNMEADNNPTSLSSIQPISKPSPHPPQKRTRVVGPVAKQNELLQKACSFLESSNQPQQDIPTIAKAWGEKLLTLDPQQRLFAKKAINDILFEASVGTLHRNSVQINEVMGSPTILSTISAKSSASLDIQRNVISDTAEFPVDELQGTSLLTLYTNFTESQ